MKRWLTSRIGDAALLEPSDEPSRTRIFSAESAAVGSSMSSSRGSNWSARATATIWRSPPDSVPISRSRVDAQAQLRDDALGLGRIERGRGG